MKDLKKTLNDIVKIQGDNGEVRVSTKDLFKKFGYKEHRKFKKVIFDNRLAFEQRGCLPLERPPALKATTGGGISTSYLLNQKQFTLLVILVKNTPSSNEFKLRVADEFDRMVDFIQSGQVESFSEQCDKAVKELSQGTNVASIAGTELAKWKKSKKELNAKVEDLKKEAQLALPMFGVTDEG